MTTPKKSRAHPTSPPAATRSKSGWLIASLLVLAAFALYGKGLHYPLVFDDRVFRDDVFRHYTAAIFKLDTRWFAYATFGWTWEIVGKQWAWHRAINVLLHAGAAFMLFQFLSRLYTIALDTKGAANPQHTQWRWIAAMGALLFLVHPVAVYGVAYLTQRSIVMATLFGLLSLWLFLEGLARRQSPAWFYGAVATYFVAVFSKEHSVMIPAVALALTVLVRGMPSRDWRELLLPFALMGAIAVFVTLRIKGVLFTAYEPFAQETLARMAEPADTPEASLGSSIINQGYLFFHYLLVWLLPNPHWMTVDARPVFPSTWLGWPHTAGFVAWLAWFVVAVAQLRKGGVRGVCGFIMLFPWLMALTEVATLRVQEPLVLYRSYLWMCVVRTAAVGTARRLQSAAALGDHGGCRGRRDPRGTHAKSAGDFRQCAEPVGRRDTLQPVIDGAAGRARLSQSRICPFAGTPIHPRAGGFFAGHKHQPARCERLSGARRGVCAHWQP